jgi:hypothetical protein
MNASDLIPIVISLASLGIVAYKEFFEGPKLSSALDQIGTMRMGEDKKHVLLELLTDDVQSSNPSPAATSLLVKSTNLQDALRSASRDRIQAELATIASRPGGIRYDAPDEAIRDYVLSKQFPIALYLPIIITNSGKRVGHLSSLTLVLESERQRRIRYVFSAMAQIDPVIFMKIGPNQRDSDRLSGIFPGVSVAPGSSVHVHALMVPMLDIKRNHISDSYLRPGKYKLSVFGHGHDGQLLLRSPRINADFPESYFINAFKGSESINYLSSEANVLDALRLLDSDPALPPWA